MTNILYRLPHQQWVHELKCIAAPLVLQRWEQIGEQEGFVFAPFHATEDSPILLFTPTHIERWEQPKRFGARHIDYTDEELRNRQSYARAFAQCRQSLASDDLEKIVLSRRLQLRLANDIDADDQRNLFLAACNNYPSSYVALIQTSQRGTWLIATPEVLLEEREDGLHTMALAATMSIDEGEHLAPAQWSAQHRREQGLVAQYIGEQLSSLGVAYTASPVQVKRAGQLLHLCTDFSLPASLPCTIGQIVAHLHPTPAVCGLPTATAHAHILAIEPHSRSYYSGFSGPVGDCLGTHLFVTLRCMELRDDEANLYAGGGLLRNSQEEAEWVETRRKLKTMLRLLQ